MLEMISIIISIDVWLLVFERTDKVFLAERGCGFTAFILFMSSDHSSSGLVSSSAASLCGYSSRAPPAEPSIIH